MTEVRVNRIAEPKVRIKVKPRVPPLEIELQNTGTEIQWRLGTGGSWETLVLLSAITGPQGNDGADGLVVSVAPGLGISVDSTDPANPIVTAAVQSVAALTGAITAAALKTALAIAVADITDASADGRSLISAANYAAMKTLLSIAQADVSGLTTASSPQFASIELGAATDTTLSRSSAGVLAVEGVAVPTTSSTSTLTNKRITPRVTTITSSATPTVNTDNTDIVNITALAAAITSMTTNLSGTPGIGDILVYQIKDNGTARAITWGASFAAKGVALPTTTVISKLLTVSFMWNGSNWGCVGSAQEA